MKIFLTLLVCALIGSTAYSQNLKTPAASPATTIKQDFALSSVEIAYSRPGAKDRKIFGDLVPFGKVWRTGANAATTITFGEDVSINGTKVQAGKYGLLSIPGQNEWTIIISKQTNVTSPSSYKQSEDVVRIQVSPEKTPFPIETFMIFFNNIKPASMDVIIAWENTVVSFPVSADIDKKVMLQIDELMKTDAPPYAQAAQYYLETGKDVKKALTWMDKAITENPKAFWLYHQKANALAKLGKKKQAIEIAKKSITLAKEAKNPDYVALNEKLIASLK